MSEGRRKVELSNPLSKSVVIEDYEDRAPKRRKPSGQRIRKTAASTTTTFQAKGSLQAKPEVVPAAGPSIIRNLQPDVQLPSEPVVDNDASPQPEHEGQKVPGEPESQKKQVSFFAGIWLD